jgi:hypothetical protein
MSEEIKAKEIFDEIVVEVNHFTGGAESHTSLFAKRLSLLCVNQILDSIALDDSDKKFWKGVKRQINKI